MNNLAEFKKFFLFTLIGALIVSAMIAVYTVLAGHFNEISWKVLSTLGMVILHSLISLMFIWDDERQNTFERLAFFSNVIFILIVLSFITSLFSIWEIFSYETVYHLYQTYFVLAFASLHADILSKALGKKNYMDTIIYINFFVMALVVLMILPIIYISNVYQVFGEMYYRILAALGIIDGTLSVLTIIFYKLYIRQNPQQKNDSFIAPKKSGLNFWVWILIIYLIFQIVIPFIFQMAFYRRGF